MKKELKDVKKSYDSPRVQVHYLAFEDSVMSNETPEEGGENPWPQP